MEAVKADRNIQIFQEHEQGLGYRKLAAKHGISDVRVRQILDKMKAREYWWQEAEKEGE